MQGSASLLNIITIPPGATQTSQRIVIDGTRGAIFEYTNGGPLGALVSSWAATAGTDPYGNTYPAGFNIGSGSVFAGTDFDLNSAGLFFYSGTPALGNLIASATPASGVDSFGNVYGQGLTTYIYSGGDQFALRAGNIGGFMTVTFSDLTHPPFELASIFGVSSTTAAQLSLSSGAETSSFVPSSIALVSSNTSGLGVSQVQITGQIVDIVNGVLRIPTAAVAPTAASGYAILHGDSNQDLRELTQGGMDAVVQLGQTDTTITGPITPTVLTGITKSWAVSPVDSSEPGRTFRLTAVGKASFSTTAASNTLTFGAGALGNTAVTLPIGSGEWLSTSIQATAWKAVLIIVVQPGTSTVDISLEVVISVNSGNLLTVSGTANASFAGHVFQNGEAVNLSVTQNILLFAKFSGSTGGPNITCYDSTLERVR